MDSISILKLILGKYLKIGHCHIGLSHLYLPTIHGNLPAYYRMCLKLINVCLVVSVLSVYLHV
jgi:hypothetical protein